MRTIESINLIWRRPGCRGGRPTIIGRGLKVKRIVEEQLYDADRPTPEEVAERFGAVALCHRKWTSNLYGRLGFR